MMFVDLDEGPTLFQRVWFWSFNRPNLAFFRRSDYHGDPTKDLKSEVLRTVREKSGLALNGPVRILTHFRYFGYCFNPVSFYYCYDLQNNLRAIVSEIENTPWGERHAYVHVASPQEGTQRFKFEKAFHVSPFFEMGLNYDWGFNRPGDKLLVNMLTYKGNDRVFDATLMLQRAPITARNLYKTMINFPLMTLKVLFAIYFQAMVLWLKGIPFLSHPNPKSQKSFLFFKGKGVQ